MAIKLYGYEKCSTCRKAQSFLNGKKRPYESIDITTAPPSRDELKAMLAHVGGDIRRLFNTSGKVYREMKLSESMDSMSEAEALKLLTSNGMLVKRPFLMINGKAAAIGFNEKDWNDVL